MPNDKAYRTSRRITAYADTDKLKPILIKAAEKHGRSPSQEVCYALNKYYGIKK